MKTPIDVLNAFEEAAENLNFGDVVLKVTFHDGKPYYRIVRKVSFIPDCSTSGAVGRGNYAK